MLKKTVFLDRDGAINEEVSYLHKAEDFRFLPGVVEGMKLLYEHGFQLVVITNQAGIGRGYYTEEDAELLHRYMREELRKQGILLQGIYYCPHHLEGLPPYNMDCSCRKPKAGLFYQAEWDMLTEERNGAGRSIKEQNKVDREKELSCIESIHTMPIHSPYRLTAREESLLEEENRTLPERKKWLSSSYMIGDKLLDCRAGKNFGVNPILLGTGYGKEELEKAKKEGKQDFSYFPTFLDAVKAIL